MRIVISFHVLTHIGVSLSSMSVTAHHAVRRSSLVETADRITVSRWVIRGDADRAGSKWLPGAARWTRQLA
jgi:hypothetical protein